MAARPQSRNFKAEREARAKEQAERRKQNKGNNRDQQQNGNRQKTTAVMVAKPGQGNRDNRRFNDQGKNHKVKGIVAMIAVSNKTSSPSKLAHVLTLKPVQQP